jgi:hypothetical protein
MSLYSLKKYTGSAALSAQLYNGTVFKFIELRLHLSTPGTGGTFEMTLVSASGAAYNMKFVNEPMVGVQDLYFRLPNFIRANAGDTFVFTWSNPGNATYGLEVQYQC